MRRAFKHISRRSLSTGASGAAQSQSVSRTVYPDRQPHSKRHNTRALLSSQPQLEPAMADQSNVRTPVLVVGGGRMGHIRAAAFMGSRRATLAGIVESDPRRALEMGETYHCPVYSSLDKALAECPRIGGVWVATPTPTHKETVSLAIRVSTPCTDLTLDYPCIPVFSCPSCATCLSIPLAPPPHLIPPSFFLLSIGGPAGGRRKTRGRDAGGHP